jgi:hypothetical protein
MALYDWNHDGKKDFTDDYIEYRIFQDSMKKASLIRQNQVEGYQHLVQSLQ